MAPDREPDLEYLCVDAFMRTLIDVRALKTALEMGMIDQLAAGRQPMAGGGMDFLMSLLRANRVVEEHAGQLRLTEAFQVALRYRDLLEAKLDFVCLIASDFAERFTDLIVDPGRFMRDSKLLELFDYSRCFEPTDENLQRTRQWVRLTTALTRYEADVVLAMHDFSRYGRMLDIGGNSGEFVLRVCKAHADVRAAVADLPVVCRIGQEHVGNHPEAGRIEFVPGNALADPLPGGMDVVTFKSILHDWPEEAAGRFIERADECLKPGGTLLIFERGPIQVGDTTPPCSLLPMLLFFRSFRGPGAYLLKLEAMGYQEVRVRGIELETPFFLVTARKPG